MKSSAFKSTLGAALLMLPLALSAADTGSVQSQIASLEKSMNEAYAANDLPKYFGYYAEDMSAIFYNERSTLPEYRKSWTASVKAGNVVTAVKLSDMQVKVLPGNAAIASFRIDVDNRHADGKKTSEKAFETDVWVKTPQGWKVQHAHYALAVPAPQ